MHFARCRCRVMPVAPFVIVGAMLVAGFSSPAQQASLQPSPEPSPAAGPSHVFPSQGSAPTSRPVEAQTVPQGAVDFSAGAWPGGAAGFEALTQGLQFLDSHSAAEEREALVAAGGAGSIERRPGLPARKFTPSEVATIGGRTVGALHMFGYAEDCSLRMFGFQYVRNSFGHLSWIRIDYMAEVIPLIQLTEPAHYDQSANPVGTQKTTINGADVVPAGARLLFAPASRWKPYLVGAGGVAYFSSPILSPQATRLNFSAEFGGGLQVEINRRAGLRFGYSTFHLSNGNTGHHNPALDTNLIYVGTVLHLHARGEER